MEKRIKISLLIAVFSLFFTELIFSQEKNINFNVIVKKGKISEMILVYAKRQNFIERPPFSGQINTYPDGIVFYFAIYLKNSGTPSLREFRDFSINGISYLEITRENNINDIEPSSIMYSESTFQRDENYEIIKFEKDKPVHIMKTIICGSQIPKEGIIDLYIYFGINNELEEFHFQLKVEDVL